jgi:hypothetical protein
MRTAGLGQMRKWTKLPVLDVRQMIFKGDQTAINNEKLGIRRADPMLLCFLKSEP